MIPQPPQRPERISLSPSTSRRAVTMSSANARSAVVSSSTPGVLVMITPAAVPAATSRLSKPTATLATIFTVGSAASTRASIFSVNRQTSASLPRHSAISSSVVGARSCGQTLTSKCWRSNSSPTSGILRLTKTCLRPCGSAKRRALRTSAIAHLGGDILRRLDHRFDEPIFLHRLLAHLGHREGDRCHRPAGIVEQRRADGIQPFFYLFICLGVPLAADLFELLAQRFRIGDGVLGEACQRFLGDDALAVVAIETREQSLSDRRRVQRPAGANVGADAHRTATVDLVDDHELRIVQDAEKSGLAEIRDQLLQQRLGDGVGLHRAQDAAADLEGTHAQRVASVVRVPLDEATRAQRLEDPVHAALGETDRLSKLADAHFLGLRPQILEDHKCAIDRIDLRLATRFGRSCDLSGTYSHGLPSVGAGNGEADARLKPCHAIERIRDESGLRSGTSFPQRFGGSWLYGPR